MILLYKGNYLKYKLLHLFEFNSNRKRMSVVIRDEEGRIKIICKGADSVIIKRLDPFKK
jgi:magnesium-transporting ATPase (P-type)